MHTSSQAAPCSLRTNQNNDYRLRRVLEILVQTGQPRAALDLDTEAQLDYDFRCFFLNSPRPLLLPRIDARCCHMVEHGLLQARLPAIEQPTSAVHE